MAGTDQRVRTAQALIMLVCLVLVALAGKLIYIQQAMRPALLEWSQRRQMTTIPLPAVRGSIVDRQRRVLAGSQDLPTIFADPRMVQDHADAARTLAPILNMSAPRIQELLDKPAAPGYVALRRASDAIEEHEIESLRNAADAVRKLNIRGIGVTNEPVRSYPMGSLGAHVLGFVGADGSGLEGVELACDSRLRGTAGKRVVFCDVQRRPIFPAPDSFVPPKDGMQVLVTIDSAIQETVERELSGAVQKFNAESGVAIVMNPKTGEVLALSCSPTYTPARASKFPPGLRRNRVLTDPVEPGSIFKPFVMAAALEAGVVRPTDHINCSFGQFGKRRLHDHHAYGVLTAEQVVAKSSNIGMAVIGQRLGNRRMHDALSELGFGRLTGIGLPGEGPGLFMPLSAWNSYTTTSVPMGHELAITPIQAAAAFSTLVNGGKSVRPYVIAAVLDQDGRVVEDRRPEQEQRQVIEPTAAAAIHEILVKVVLEGTGKACQLDKWQVMGKTGTAQVPRADRRGYEPNAYLASFIAAAPASDPALTVLVMVRKPRGAMYYGSQVALPVVKAIFEQTLPYLNVPPDKLPGGVDVTKLALDARD